jgi:hypothetical protein
LASTNRKAHSHELAFQRAPLASGKVSILLRLVVFSRWISPLSNMPHRYGFENPVQVRDFSLRAKL